jgi:hypothetical protein
MHILFAISALLLYCSIYFEFYKKKVYLEPSGSIFNFLDSFNPVIIIYSSAFFVTALAWELWTIFTG